MKRLALILLLSAAFGAAAQNTHWEVGLNGSWMTPNNFNMPEYSAWSGGADVAWAVRMVGDDYQLLWRRYPTFGVRGSVEYIPVDYAGIRIGALAFLRAPLWGRLDYSLGAGLSAFSRSSFFTHDEDNIFINSLICCLIDVGFVYNLTDRVMLSATFLHSSNGQLVRPNKGLNFLQAGVTVKLGENSDSQLDWRHSRESIDSVPPYHRHEVGFTLSPGVAMSRNFRQDGLFFDYDLSLNYRYYLNPIIATGATLDLWYNFSHWQQMVWYDDPYRFPMYVGVMWTLEGHWGPLSIDGGVGANLLRSSRVDTPVYERLGAYYNWGNNYAGVGINAHLGKIEFIEWSYGHRFPLGRKH